MLWLYLLGAVTLLVIALRRVLRRQKPLDDALYAKNVAVEHVQSGVAWVRADGILGSANQSLAGTLRVSLDELVGKEWLHMFPAGQRGRIREHYSQMLLKGIATFDAPGLRGDKSEAWLNVRLVAVHDHSMRFVGHHCLIEDRTDVRELEHRIRQLTDNSPVNRIHASLSQGKPISKRASTTGSGSLGSPIATAH